MNILEKKIIFALAQDTFIINENRFAYLLPLLTVDGESIDRQFSFPSNGCCWWMVKGTGELINSKAGRLFVGNIEPAINPEKCHYQVVLNSVSPAGRKTLIEILTVTGNSVYKLRDLINKRHIITLDHQPTSSVLVRWKGLIYGPFQTDVEELSGSLGAYKISFNKIPSQNDICGFKQKDVTGDMYHKVIDSITDDTTPYEHVTNFRKCEFEFILMPKLDEQKETAQTTPTLRQIMEFYLSYLKQSFLERVNKNLFLIFKSYKVELTIIFPC